MAEGRAQRLLGGLGLGYLHTVATILVGLWLTPFLIHRLTYRRTNHDSIHVRGYKEEGTTTTPFDMTVLNDLDRYHLIEAVIDFVPSLRERAAHIRQRVHDKLVEHREYIRVHGEDMPEIRNWRWTAGPTQSR